MPSQVENLQKYIKLPDQEPEVFHIYLECVYASGAVHIANLSGLSILDGNVANEDQGVASIGNLFKLWIALDYLCDLKLTNEVMDGILFYTDTNSGYAISWASLILVYNNTVPWAALLRWIVDWLASRMDPKQLSLPDAATIPRGFLVLILQRFLKRKRSGRVPNFAQRSKYHI